MAQIEKITSGNKIIYEIDHDELEEVSKSSNCHALETNVMIIPDGDHIRVYNLFYGCEFRLPYREKYDKKDNYRSFLTKEKMCYVGYTYPPFNGAGVLNLPESSKTYIESERAYPLNGIDGKGTHATAIGIDREYAEKNNLDIDDIVDIKANSAGEVLLFGSGKVLLYTFKDVDGTFRRDAQTYDIPANIDGMVPKGLSFSYRSRGRIGQFFIMYGDDANRELVLSVDDIALGLSAVAMYRNNYEPEVTYLNGFAHITRDESGFHDSKLLGPTGEWMEYTKEVSKSKKGSDATCGLRSFGADLPDVAYGEQVLGESYEWEKGDFDVRMPEGFSGTIRKFDAGLNKTIIIDSNGRLFVSPVESYSRGPHPMREIVLPSEALDLMSIPWSCSLVEGNASLAPGMRIALKGGEYCFYETDRGVISPRVRLIHGQRRRPKLPWL